MHYTVYKYSMDGCESGQIGKVPGFSICFSSTWDKTSSEWWYKVGNYRISYASKNPIFIIKNKRHQILYEQYTLIYAIYGLNLKLGTRMKKKNTPENS